MKYIMFEDFSGRRVPIIFPDRIDHEEMREQIPYAKVISAGFVGYSQDQGFRCHGESKSLGVKADPEDAETIARRLAEPES
jgi:hypothetical protein